MKPFLKLVAEDIKHRFGDDFSDIAIVFNNKRPITYLKKHLADVFEKTIWSPQFFTIQEFFKQSTKKQEASALQQFFLLFELHNSLLTKEGLEPELLEDFYPIAEIILNDFGQIDYDLVAVDQIFMDLYDHTKIELEFQHFTEEQKQALKNFWQSFTAKGHTALQIRFLKLWHRLPVLYKQFKEKLSAENLTNFPTIYRDLAEQKANHCDFITSYKKVLFVGFNALSKAEVTLFQRWKEQDKALFYFDTDAYYLDDPLQEAGLFLRKNLYQFDFENALGPAENYIGERHDTIHLFAASGKVSETKLLFEELSNNPNNEQSTAILLADESLIVPLLQSLPPVEVNITTGYPLIQSPVYGLIDLWLNVQEEISHFHKKTISVSYIETFLNHPIVKIPVEKKKEIETKIYSRQLLQIDIEDLISLSEEFAIFFLSVPKSSDFVGTMIQLIEYFIGKSPEVIQNYPIEDTLLFEVRKTLLQLQLGLESVGPLHILFQIGLVRKALATVSAAIEGDPLQGIQIMGLLESRCLNFDRIYLLGANEDVLPKSSASPTFLPNNLRRAYGLPVLENQDALSAYLFYRQISYSKNIHVFYNSNADSNGVSEESRFIKQLLFESNFKFIRKTQEQPVYFDEAEPALIIPKTDAIWHKMKQKFIINKYPISASAFTKFLESPLQFFLKYIAEIHEPPRSSEEFELNSLGQVIHKTMELIFTPFLDSKNFFDTKKLKEVFPKMDDYILLAINDTFHTEYTSLNDLNSLERIMHKITYEYVMIYVQYDIENYVQMKIVELENNEDYKWQIPVTVDGEEVMITIKGIIDRVDQVIIQEGEIITRIVDYKTGSDSVYFRSADESGLFVKSKDNKSMNKALVQTMFYTYIYEKVQHKFNLEPNLYVARSMRQDGALFISESKTALTAEFLVEKKRDFEIFLQTTLQRIFDRQESFYQPEETKIYDSDPYTLFYRGNINEEEEDAE